MMNCQIRRARPGDEQQLAKIHIRCWQQAYEGIVPKTYLETLSNELSERTLNWERTLKNPQRTTWVAEVSGDLIGFILFGPPRDDEIGGEHFTECAYEWTSLELK